jgi:Tfp pilus assembly protein FimT
MLVSVTVIAILAGIAAPRLLDTMRRQEFALDAGKVTACLNVAQRLAVAPQDAQNQRWIVARVNQVSTGEISCRVYAAPESVLFRDLHSGMLDSGAAVTLASLTPIPEATTATAGTTILANTLAVNAADIGDEFRSTVSPQDLIFVFGAREGGRLITVAFGAGAITPQNIRKPQTFAADGASASFGVQSDDAQFCALYTMPQTAKQVSMTLYRPDGGDCATAALQVGTGVRQDPGT